MIEYLVSIATVGVLYSLIALALNVRWGWAGELDLAIFAFVAIGAYTDAVMTLPPSQLPPPDGYILGLNLPWPVGVLGAMVVSGVLAAMVGAVALRKLRGDYFAITTVATAFIIAAVISQDTPLFNGFNGVYGLSEPFNSVLHLGGNAYPVFYLGLCVVALVIVYLVLERLRTSPFGRTLRAIRENETAAAAFARNVYVEKLKAYVIGGVVAGLAGSLLAHFLSAFNPASWQPEETFLLYAAIFVGGSGNTRGVIIGAFFIFVAIQEVTRFLPPIPNHPDAASAVRAILIGSLIIVVLRWRPRGLVPEPRPRDIPASPSNTATPTLPRRLGRGRR